MEKQVAVSTFYRLMAKIYGITLFIFNEAGTLTEQYSSEPGSAEFLLSFANLKERIFLLCSESKKPQVISSELGQLWAGIPVVEGERITNRIVLGPVFTSGGSTQLMLDYVRSYNISTVPREKLLDALNHSPVCAYLEFTRLIAIVYAFIYGEELDTSALPIAGLTNHDLLTAPERYGEEKGAPRKESGINPTYALGQNLSECIQTGDMEKLKRLLKTFNYSQVHYLSLPDPIRQQKDMFISLIAQVVNAAVQGGLNPEAAYSLNDRYIQQVETMTNMLPIIALTREMLYDYTSRVGRLKRTHQYSKLINDCCSHIHEHIYENLRVTDVADFSGHNAHYLSQKFRAETGQSIRDYIRSAKIAEAKSLLKYSSRSLADISEQLAFSSQSFFTTAFRQATGLTPGQFRENAEF
jgi:AraC-like DNA-binding protein